MLPTRNRAEELLLEGEKCSQGVMDIEERMEDVRRRYGSYPQDKWDDNLALKSYFEKKMNWDIYSVTEQEAWTVFRIKKAGLQDAGTLAELAVQIWDNTLQEMAEDICGTMAKKDACFFSVLCRGASHRICPVRAAA